MIPILAIIIIALGVLICAYLIISLYKAFDIAIEALEQTRWIPVSEDLPKDHDWYLAVFKEKDTGFQLIPRVAGYTADNTWIMLDEDAMCQGYRDLLECVAWTQLPKPYKQESDD